MAFFRKLQPRRFSYVPRYSKTGEEEHKVRFRHISHFNRKQSPGNMALYLAVILLVVAIIYFLGGIRKPLVAPELTEEDAVRMDSCQFFILKE